MPASEPVPQAGTTISPKVKAATVWAAIAGVAVTLGGAALTAVAAAATPDNFAGLGAWAVPAASVVATGAAAGAAWIGGYRKRDPLRDMTPVLNPLVVTPAGGETTDGVAAGPASTTANPPAAVDVAQAAADDAQAGAPVVAPDIALLTSGSITFDGITTTGPRHLDTAAAPADEHPQP